MAEDEKQDHSSSTSGARMLAGRARKVRDELGSVSPLEDVVIDDLIHGGQSVEKVIDVMRRRRGQKADKDRQKQGRLREIIDAVRRRLGPEISAEQIAAILSDYEHDPSLTEDTAVGIASAIVHHSSANTP